MAVSLRGRIAEARRALVAAGVATDSAGLDAEVLARHVLGWDRAQLLARGHEAPPPGFELRFAPLVTRRAEREPVAYILRRREFWGLDFEVTPDVLIPRPETELLVDEALSEVRDNGLASAADVGTGSGCVAVTLARELPALHVVATDASTGALAVAQRNAERHGVTDRVTFRYSDLLSGPDGPFQLVVSNPPYVPEADAGRLEPEVLRYEPRAALFAGPDGLAILRRLLADVPGRLVPGGRLIVEFGFGQEVAVRELAAGSGWRVRRVRQDLQGIPRVMTLARSDGPDAITAGSGDG